MYQNEDGNIQYGRHHFSDVSQFFAFLKLQDCKEKLLKIRREVFSRLFSIDSEGFSTIEKFNSEIQPARLSPTTQKMRGSRCNQITPEKLNAIFSLAMGLQSARERGRKAEKAKNNRFMRNRLKNK